MQTIPAFQPGWAEATITDLTRESYWGLCDNDTDRTASTIDYAFYLFGPNLRIYENGVLKKTVTNGQATGDRLRIARVGSAISYYRNNELIYASATGSTSLLRLDFTLGSNNATILNLNLSTSKTTTDVTRFFDYDHAGRLTRTWHKINDNDKVLLSENKYNELGQLIDKKLHSKDSANFDQSIDYAYNIRGWLTSMNGEEVADDGDEDARPDLFDMDLYYNKAVSGLGNTSMYNGNISAMRWKAASGDVKERGYLFGYDPMNRLTSAANKTKVTTWQSGNGFKEDSLKYDLNGNITRLRRTTKDGSFMDDLRYDYGDNTNASNRLLKVTDSGDVNSGFTDDTRSAEDYRYDQNGNMIADNNKSISVFYNHLNLPGLVVKTTNERIIYFYDSDGRKVSQVVLDASGVQTKVTDYEGEFIYENNKLLFINHEEGRVIMDSVPEYQYHLKDHLGNVRLTFTTKKETDESKANFEADTGTEFEYYNEAVRINSEVFDHTNIGTTHYSARLNGTQKERFGLAKSLKVMPGDTVRAEVFAKYLDPDTAWVNGMPAFINSIVNGTAPAGTFKDGGLAGSTGGVLVPFWALFGDEHGADNDNAPKAYLNWLVFDNDYNLIPSKSGYKQISRTGREYGQDGSHDTLTMQVAIQETGYVYVYLSNDNYELEGEIVDVFFDDLKVEHVKSPVISSQDYYPFGLTFNSYSRENSTPNQYKFNGIEEQDELGLNVLGAFFRTGDPAIGRWWQIDPKVDDFYGVSPYNMMNNNPVSLTDPLGDEWADPKKDEKVAASIKKGLDKANERLEKANDKLQGKLAKAQEKGNAGKVEKLVMKMVQNSVAIETNNNTKTTLDRMGEKGEGIPKFTFKQSTNDEQGGTEINRIARVVEMTVTRGLGNRVHEVTHGWNFSPKGDKIGGDEGLEIRAYRAQYAADPGSLPNSDDPWSRSNISDISGRYVGGIRDKNGNIVYKDINKKYKNDYPKK